MATDIVQSLFGVTPEMYQQQQDALAEARALKFAQMDPLERANYNIYRGASQLGGVLGRALGGEDPELARISARQAIASQIDFNDPTSIENAVRSLQQSGDISGAMMLMQTADEAAKRQLARTEQAEKTRQLGLTTLAERIAASAYQPAVPQRDDFGNLMTGVEPTPASFDISRVQPQLMALGAPGIAKLKQLQEAQALTQPKYEKAGDVWYKVVPGQVPEPIGGVFKKGEKLATRDAQGNWSYVTPTGATAPVSANENPIIAMIQGNALHSTVLPYANQLARSFVGMDSEDQDKAMLNLTRLNSDAVSKEATLQGRQDANALRQQTAALTQALLELKIDAAKRAAAAAADGKPLPTPALEKLAKQSDQVAKQEDLLSSFKGNYVGYKLDTLGQADISLALRSNDPNRLALGSWWQKYQENVNKVRNELFGSALTATEAAAFERQMVTPAMSEQAARANLAAQAEAAKKAYDKIAKGLLANGYSKSAIASMSPYVETAPTTSPAAPAAPVAPGSALPGGAVVRRVQ